jgi:hypothetical protein
LAKSILEYILAESVIFKSAVKPFKSLDFEWIGSRPEDSLLFQSLSTIEKVRYNKPYSYIYHDSYLITPVLNWF